MFPRISEPATASEMLFQRNKLTSGRDSPEVGPKTVRERKEKSGWAGTLRPESSIQIPASLLSTM